jgi:hypothetical protein
MRRLLISLLCLTISGPALAQVSIGTGGTITLFRQGGHLSDASELFAEAEYQLGFAAHQWLGAVIATDGGAFTGTALRYYYGSPDALVFPGLGLGMYVINASHKEVTETTAVLGFEANVELHIPFGDGSLPLSIGGGWYPSIGGDRLQMIRFGATFKPGLIEGGVE